MRFMKSSKIDHKEIETKWQAAWERVKLNETPINGGKKSFYNLMMFPYPSAEGLHVGNMYAFTGSDVYGRFKRLQGFNVFEPIGLDGFGIHSENYALKVGRHPMDHAAITQKNFYAQLHKIGAMFDWTRTVETYDTDYYRWTQWLFTQMFKKGLAYRSKAEVNFCPSCKTVLADEQVIEGKCERCGNIVEKRLLEQWFFKITAYAEKLLENSFSLDWSEKVKVAQKNWIGKKEGINISYDVVDDKKNKIGEIICFTTRPDTNFGATFVVIAPEHPFVSQILEVIKTKQSVKITKYVNDSKKKSEDDRKEDGRKKTGVETGLFCLNKLNGSLMPLYISDFVLMGFGTGAVVGVPGHDLRDFEFAQTFQLPILRVVKGQNGDVSPITKKEQVQEEEGVMTNSEFLDGMDIQKAISAMMDHFEKKKWGKRVTTYHLRDWLISRQRYWGPPIPMIRCDSCLAQKKGERQDMPGWWAVPDDQLPVLLPRIDDYKPGDDGVAPLAKHKEFYEVDCPGCGKKAKRETDVSDTFLDSSWYFLRYPSVGSSTSKQEAFDTSITKEWLPVHMYTGGAEHSVLHLMGVYRL
jgi:leucyl-tRNA synthetase